MFIQEKRYLVLWKSQKDIAKAGLLKLSRWEKRIKVDYFLNTLPIYYDCDAKCIVHYKLSGDQHSRKSEWNFNLTKNQVQYEFQFQSSSDIESVESCYITLAGNYIIAGEREFINDLVFIKDSEFKSSNENENGISENKDENIKENTLLNVNENNADTSILTEKDKEEDKGEEGEVKSSEIDDKLKNESLPKIRKVEYIQDIQYLLKQKGKISELYYNSFLLHGFYQYRHFVICPEFIGVPGNFYEREAIAAKVMGFPYFIEAEFLDNCQLGGNLRQELPNAGTFGYYLKNLDQYKMGSD